MSEKNNCPAQTVTSSSASSSLSSPSSPTTPPPPPPPPDEAPRHGDALSSHVPGPPRLEYSLWDHRKKLTVITFLLMCEFCFIPIALYYPLWYRTSLRHGIIFAIITSFFGIITGLEFAQRSWRLLMPAPTYRPAGGHRWGLDATHWILATVYTAMTAILIGASIPHEPVVRALALPPAVFLLSLSALLLGSSVLHYRGAALPFRVSSTAAGARLLPLTYTLVEDIVGVDGGAGVAYRERLARRWHASGPFRQLLARLSWLWGAGLLAGGVATMVVLWATSSRDVAYGVGWGVPMVVVCVLTAATFVVVRHGLRKEAAVWGSM